MDFNILPTTNITKMFGNWLSWVTEENNINTSRSMCFDLGQMDVRNEFVINNAKSSSFMEAIPLATDGAVLAAQLGILRGRYEEHSSKFSSVVKPRFIEPAGERQT
jgi:hypothetical protein